ncbi:MAG: NAD(P)H-binding protein [Mycobacterium sp.]
MIIVVTGATGNVGRPLVAELVQAGATVRAVSRDPATAGLPADVEVLSSVREAMPGASAVFLNSRALGAAMDDVVAHARHAGVAKLVALSAINSNDDESRQPSRVRGDRNREVDELVAGSGLTWVSLRPSVFASNFAGMWAGQIRTGDAVAGPYATASSAPIAESDISAVAAQALLTDRLDGLRVPLTGPEALTNTELVDIIADVLGRPLRYHEIPPDVVRQRFLGLGFPADFGTAYVAMLAQTVAEPALVTRDVEKILGRPARTFADWVAGHHELFN